MVQLIIGLVVIYLIFKILEAVFTFFAHLIVFSSINFLALNDKLFGSWSFVSPPVSWALMGFCIGALLYFAVRESDKLSRPAVKPILIAICCPLLFLSSIIFTGIDKSYSTSANRGANVRTNEWVINGQVGKCDKNDRSTLQSGKNNLCYRATSTKKLSKARVEYIWNKDNKTVCRNSTNELNHGGNTSRCSRNFDPGSYEVQLVVNGEVKDRVCFNVAQPANVSSNTNPHKSVTTSNRFKGAIHNEDSVRALYIHHPDTDLELKIDPAQHFVIEVTSIPDTIKGRFDGEQSTTKYTIFKKEGKYNGVDVAFGASIQDGNSTKKLSSDASRKYTGVVVNEDTQSLYLYHPDTAEILTVKPKDFVFLQVNKIPGDIKGRYGSRQDTFVFKAHKKEGNYRGTQVEFGARVQDPARGS